jgi:hypothetical protein
MLSSSLKSDWTAFKNTLIMLMLLKFTIHENIDPAAFSEAGGDVFGFCASWNDWIVDEPQRDLWFLRK